MTINYRRNNLFTVDSPSDGQNVGASEILIGAGLPAAISILNPGGGTIVMEVRASTGNTDWTVLGDTITDTRRLIVNLLPGLEYRMNITTASQKPITVSTDQHRMT